MQHVTDFCNLLTQWSQGQRTLDTKIYSMCSGNDCSAYDDVTAKKETTMRNYLLGIQKKYPQSLPMQISQPSLANAQITYEPVLSFGAKVGRLSNDSGYSSPDSYIDMGEFSIDSYKNAYISFYVNQTIPKLGINTSRIIVYDVNAQKVTAFVTGGGTFTSYLEGLNLMTKNDYKSAIAKFEIASSNNRSSLKSSSLILAIVCSIYSSDFASAKRFAKALNDPLYNNYIEAMDMIIEMGKDDNWNYVPKILSKWLECEQIASKNAAYKEYLPAIYLNCGMYYSLPRDYFSGRDVNKALYYFKKAIAGGNTQAAIHLWIAFMDASDDEIDEMNISGDELMGYLEWAANKGQPFAILFMGKLEESGNENMQKAIYWYQKGADNGDPFSMACLGKLLLQKGGNNVETGKKWRRKSLEGNRFELQREAYEGFVTENFWPNSRNDIQSLLGNVPNNNVPSTHTNTIPSTTANTSSISSNNTSSNITNYSKIRKRKYHGSFNKKKDNFIGGFSLGYIQKQWVYEEDGEKEKGGLFDDEKYINGIQAGFRIDPQFGAGFGVNTGLFYEYCWSKSDDNYDDYGSYHITYEEHGLYLPLHLKFTMNFSRWFQLSFFGGAGLNYVLSGKAYMRDDGETYDTEDVYKEEDNWKRFNTMLEYGVSVRIDAFQFDFSICKGLTNWSPDENYKTTQGRPVNLSLTFCF